MASLLLSLFLCNPLSRDAELLRTWRAIVQVESGGNCAAVGDSGLAVGPAQLHPCYVRDANRILGRQAFQYSDRTDLGKSWAMFVICTKHYCPDGTPEQIAKTFHRGSPVEREQYWQRVKAAIR